MRIFSLLNEAELLIQATVSDLVRFVSLESLSLELCSAPEPAIVVGKVSQIDNKLADVVYAAGVRGVSVGLLPYDGQYPESLSRLLQPSVPIQDGAATIGLYSSRGLSFDFREPEHPVSAKLVNLKRKSEDEGRSTPLQPGGCISSDHAYRVYGLSDCDRRQTDILPPWNGLFASDH
ncbi:hypothetical protein ACVWZV_000240 [Bradyrhizobium sp. GM5.1]